MELQLTGPRRRDPHGSPPDTAADRARNALFAAVTACAEDLQRQLADATTPQSLRTTISRFAREIRTLPFPPERAIAAFTFMLDGVLDPAWSPLHGEEVRLDLMRTAIEECFRVRCDDTALR